MKKILLALTLASLAFTVGCADPVTSGCKKAIECLADMADEGFETYKTVEECVDENEKMMAPYRKSDKAECKAALEAYENVMACHASLSCDELKNIADPSGEQACKAETEAFQKAAPKAADCYFENLEQES